MKIQIKYTPLIIFVAILFINACAINKSQNSANKDNLTIAKEKTSEYQIVLPVNPSEVEESAANELKIYIEKSTGAVLHITNEDKKVAKAIYIGNTKYAAKNKAIINEPEGWIIKASGTNLILTGGKTRGVLYAVYHFLEDVVGVRWWDPWEEYVPMIGQLSIRSDLSLHGVPSFAYRDLYDSIFDDMGIDPKTAKADYSLYQARNRLNGHFSFTPQEYGGRIKYGKPYHVHTFSRYFPVKKYFSRHPEWYAWSKDKKTRIDDGQLCLSNKELLEVFKQKVRDSIFASYQLAQERGETKPEFFSVSLNDLDGLCECDDCSKLYIEKGKSGYAIFFVNKIADYIAAVYPEVKIETLSYWQYIIPPLDNTKPAKNVVLRLAEEGRDLANTIENRNNKDVLQRLKQWQKLCDNNNLYIWDYYLNYSNATHVPMFRFQQDLEIYKKHGAQGIFGEIEWPLVADMWNMRVWMLAKLFENIHLNTDSLIADFAVNYYAEAAPQIKEYLYMVRKSVDSTNSFISFRTNVFAENYFTLDIAIKANKLFEEALSNVKDNEVAARRVRHARSYFDKVIVRRTAFFASEAQKRGLLLNNLGLNRKLAARRIVASLQEQGKFKTLDNKTIREIAVYKKVYE